MFDAKRLKEEREKKGLSQAALARRAGVSQGLIWQLEHGLKQPSISVLTKIAKALDLSPEKLLLVVSEEAPDELEAGKGGGA